MQLTGLHLLLTYQCTLKCDHCFTWGSPWQRGSMTLPDIRCFLRQAGETGSIERIAFEGGEPFLFYSTLLAGVRAAAEMGFEVSIVTNAFWAGSEADALECLRPFAGLLQRLSVSSDVLHWHETFSRQAQYACAAATQLGIPLGVLSTAHPLAPTTAGERAQLPNGEGGVMFRGRAAAKLAAQMPGHPWAEFTTCPCENLREPARMHLDPYGNLHICQGIVLGNLWRTPLRDICAAYLPERHPITAALVAGGPAELVRRYELAHEELYADACHLCNASRQALRGRFPELLAPEQMYGGAERVTIG